MEQNKPFTGKEYLDSLDDGREIWLNGEKIKSVVDHPAFRNAARSNARLYDALHDQKYHNVLTTETDTGNGGFTHKFFRSSRTAQEMLEARDAIAAWARLNYGWMGRSPDYKASFLGTLGTNPEFYGQYQNNARRWYKEAQEKVLFFNHAIVNPPVDRHKPIHEVGDVFVHVEKETDAGLIVSGSKMVATGSALTNYNFVANYGNTPVQKEEFAVALVVQMDAPGVKLLTRPSYELKAAMTGSPFDYPLSSRMDENDAVLIFDKVLIPWENVIVYRDLETANNFFLKSGFLHRALLQGCTRFAVKLDFLTGLLLKGLETTGTIQFRGVQVNVGEVLAWRSLFWSLSTAMATDPDQGTKGTVLPNFDAALCYRVMSAIAYPKVMEIIQNIMAGALIVQPSSAEDFKNPELRPYLDKLYRGSNDYDALSKIKLIKLLWDSIGSEFAGRHELYERNYGGNHENSRLEILLDAMAKGSAAGFKEFAEQCMSEYDLEGWTDPTWINPDDVNRVKGYYDNKMTSPQA